MKLLKRKLRKNFTLLELLIIVAILAIVGGGLVSSFEGLQAQAAKASATNTIASLQNAIRTYVAVEGKLPSNVDSLLAAVPTDATAANGVVSAPTIASYVGPDHEAAAGTDAELLGNYLGDPKMAQKVEAQALSTAQVTALINAGITSVRYLDAKGLSGATDLAIPDADGKSAKVKAIGDIDIPQLGFNAPRPGSKTDFGTAADKTRARGRGFEYTLNGALATQQFAIWGGQVAAVPVADYDNTKLGADPKAVLVAFGIGPDSTLVTAGKNVSQDTEDKYLGSTGIGSAPYYGDVAKGTYPSYVMLVDVAQDPAKFVAVVDARGDFLAEEFAEQSGQKQ